MGRRGKTLAIVIVVAVLLGAVALPIWIHVEDFRPRIEAALTAALGRKVALSNLKVGFLPAKISADNVSIEDDPAFSATPFLKARSLSLGVELWPLILSRKVEITDLTIQDPAIVLLQAPSGKWNFSGLGPRSQPETSDISLSAKIVKITGGTVSIGESSGGSRPETLEHVQAELQNFSPSSAFPFSFSSKIASGGDINLQGTAGPINQTDTARTPVQGKLKVTGLKLAGSGFVDPASGIDGLLSIDGSTNSNGSSLQWQGQLKIDQIKLSRGGTPAREPIAFDFTINHDLQSHAGNLSPGNIHLGNAAATLTGTYQQTGAVIALNLHLVGSGMPVSALVGMLPPLDIVLPVGSSLVGGDVAVDLNVTGPLSGVVITGSMGLRNTRVSGFDLGGKMSTLQALAGIKSGPNTDIQSLAADLRATPAGTTVQNLKFVIPALGEVDGAGTISASHDLDFKMIATAHATGLLATGLGQRGNLKVPFFVQGRSSNPEFKPDIQGIAAAELNRLQKGNLGKSADSVLQKLFGGK